MLSKERLDDASVLSKGGRFEGARYLCGYALEAGLKARICDTLGWTEYSVGENYKSFRTHDLEVLLHLSGRESVIKNEMLAEWSAVMDVKWGPELRYQTEGSATQADVAEMIKHVRRLLERLEE